MKKTLTTILALLMAASTFTSLSGCASRNDNVQADDTTSVAENNVSEEETTADPSETLDLEMIDWEGRQFRILGRQGEPNGQQFDNFEIAAEETNGDIINDAVYERNAYIMEKYNAEVVFLGSKTVSADITKYVSSAEDAFDLSYNVLRDLKSLATAGYFINMTDIPYVDYSKNWWYEDVNDELSIGGNLYYTTSALNLMDKNRMYIMLFNKDMAEEFSLGNMYEYVRDGQFTVEKVTEFSKVVAADLNGDGIMHDDDRYGWVMDSGNGFLVQLQAMGNNLVVKDSDDFPILNVNTEKMVTDIETAAKLCLNKETSLSCEWFKGKVDYNYWGVSGRVFNAGNALFSTMFINYPNGLKNKSANCDFNYGILPFPKRDEAQEEYISVPDPAWGALFSIPKTNTDVDFTGYMLELLSYTTDEMVMPAYYETSAKGRYTYDKESEEMLDLIFSNPHYDLGVVFDWGGIKTMFVNMGVNGETGFASKYASIESAAVAAMEATVDLFLEIE